MIFQSLALAWVYHQQAYLGPVHPEVSALWGAIAKLVSPGRARGIAILQSGDGGFLEVLIKFLFQHIS